MKGVAIFRDGTGDDAGGGAELLQCVLEIADMSSAAYAAIKAGNNPSKAPVVQFMKTGDQYNSIRCRILDPDFHTTNYNSSLYPALPWGTLPAWPLTGVL